MRTDNLQRLLNLTADNRSLVVQDLRREIISYVNSQEQLTSTLYEEIESFHYKIKALQSTEKHERILRELFANESNRHK